VLGDGGWLVTWSSYGQDGSGEGVYQQRYAASGAKVGIETQVNTDTKGHQSSPDVTALSDGGWVVTWNSRDEDGSGYGIHQQRYDAVGNPVGG
jgi:serralysin